MDYISCLDYRVGRVGIVTAPVIRRDPVPSGPATHHVEHIVFINFEQRPFWMVTYIALKLTSHIG